MPLLLLLLTAILSGLAAAFLTRLYPRRALVPPFFFLLRSLQATLSPAASSAASLNVCRQCHSRLSKCCTGFGEPPECFRSLAP
jgi:hypothetical protein